MKEFINDERVIGKWKYETSALSKEHYLNGDCYEDKKALYQYLYFLPQGQGYWVFEGWSKGKIYYKKNGIVYDYEIVNDKLILTTKYINTNEVAGCLIYNKVDNKEYSIQEIVKNDNVDYPFVLDEQVIGKWICHEVVDVENLESYVPQKDSVSHYLVELNFRSNGVVEHFDKLGNHFDRKWTKNHILLNSVWGNTDSHYEIKTFDNDEYLYYEWKSGDYSFGGKVTCYYVFKKVK